MVGLAANVFITIVYGIMLPENVPTHIGPSGGIDAFGSKWVLIGVLTIIPLLLFATITLISRYPWVFNYPMAVTEENGPGLYRLGVSLMRWIKVISAWLFAMAAYIYVLILPSDPGASVGTSIVLLCFTGALLVVIVYYILRMFGLPAKGS